ncbi:lipopolysaccharide biosynthesis protein [Geofilum sp. OHC36d9]|uniref:lipopolysaccharide biosynthesis protein n=1 Tax=Geofilum sp. OHC36d9 TaxID=3458413 RepID=UPI0040338186
MGTIAKQTIQNSFFSYLGVILGGVNIAILYPRIFSEEQVGLINVLIAVSAMFAQFSSLGVNGVTNYFFHHFRDKVSRHKGYFSIIASVIIVGYVLFLIIFGLFKDQILSSKAEESVLLGQYGAYIIPITFFTLSFLVTDIYAAVLSKSVIGVFMQEFIFRCINLVLSLLFLFNIIDFSLFLFLYVLALGLPPTVIVFELYRTGNISLRRPDKSLLSVHGLKMISVGAFYILSGFGGMLITYIDRYMINIFLGLGSTGIYSISNYVGTLVQIPRRAMGKIAATSLAGLWSKHDIGQLQDLYYKSVVSQLGVGVLIFIGIWINIDAVFEILPVSYQAGKWVIFFIGLANLLHSAMGLGGVIVVTSEYYKLNTYLTFILGILAIGTNLIFIPIWGITGAAFASAFSKFIYVGINMFVIQHKLEIRSIRIEHFTIPLAGVVSYYLISLFNPEWHWIYLLIVRSLFITVAYLMLLKLFRVIPNLKDFVKNF